ncbi:MAG: hypothetical protein GY737_14435 [Desulfobacteraceae bacterium]|nr:hypothetical protein [Desulfobacteraceae bacterium]|tara:strand:- start:503 stop:871 length:369 start_codon:yes stop_codon:yes gene_type:complete
MFDNINNTKSSNLKNNNFKYVLFALLLNFVIFFLIFVQESFLIIFDQLSYYLFVDVRDLASYVFTIFVDGTMKNFLFDTFKDYYINLDSYLGSEHYIKQSKLRKIAIGFMKNKVNPNFEILN